MVPATARNFCPRCCLVFHTGFLNTGAHVAVLIIFHPGTVLEIAERSIRIFRSTAFQTGDKAIVDLFRNSSPVLRNGSHLVLVRRLSTHQTGSHILPLLGALEMPRRSRISSSTHPGDAELRSSGLRSLATANWVKIGCLDFRPCCLLELGEAVEGQSIDYNIEHRTAPTTDLREIEAPNCRIESTQHIETAAAEAASGNTRIPIPGAPWGHNDTRQLNKPSSPHLTGSSILGNPSRTLHTMHRGSKALSALLVLRDCEYIFSA